MLTHSVFLEGTKARNSSHNSAQPIRATANRISKPPGPEARPQVQQGRPPLRPDSALVVRLPLPRGEESIQFKTT